MTANDRWKRVQELFEFLEPLPDYRHNEELQRAESNPELRNEVLSLLQSIRDEELAQANARQQFAAAAPVANPRTLTQICADWNSEDPDLKLLSLIGSGGTGAVYRALRKVNGVEQHVAVKIYHEHRLAQTDRDRFTREQRMLATLTDPGIVRFFDSGLTRDGRPYLVMELAEGEYITRHCDLHRLSIEQRLQLLLSVCRALASAHARLIVHLDLKPSNILVTADGDIKLLDFGTARLIDHSQAFVVTQQLTPHYASPERLRGEPASVASDVYSLGLVLFELCSGGSPFPRQSSIIGIAERAGGRSTATGPVDAASAEAAAMRGTTLDKLRRQLKGDLASICSKALAFDADQRYTTVTELADDLRRFLAAEPVAAHPAGFAYRASKFVKRNWGTLALAAAVSIGLSTAALYSWQQAKKASVAAERAEAAQIFLTNILSSGTYDNKGSNASVPQLLELAESRVSGLRSQDPALASDIELALGMARSPDDVLGPQSAQRALDLAKASGDVTREASALALLGNKIYHGNHPEEATKYLRNALDLWSAHRSEFSPARAAWLLGQTTRVLLYLRPFDTSVREPLAACLQLSAASQTLPQYLRIDCLHSKAISLLFGSKDYSQALPLLLEEVEFRRKKPVASAPLAEALQLLGLNYRFLGRHPEDEQAQRESYQLTLRHMGPDSLAAANAGSVWAVALANSGQVKQGLTEAEAALATYRLHYPDRGSLLLFSPLSAAMTNACLSGRFTDCELYAREALQTLGPNPSTNDTRVASAKGFLGLALANLGQIPEAKPLLETALQSLRSQNRPTPYRQAMEAALSKINARP
jgi:eukaryotic-like serine/threonine-protein kinase